ncbi:hypothetical protein CHS0354_026665 [Potamilus streckersoni]|uniref:Uncharacterized protein n=1 Tax=Potamilus streckersoni TaxID=2493646 RepID=A0AAE0S8A3_9BIVA|nr:hypothetical protein CHS0354_026665 [Potamilus streckersoni]
MPFLAVKKIRTDTAGEKMGSQSFYTPFQVGHKKVADHGPKLRFQGELMYPKVPIPSRGKEDGTGDKIGANPGEKANFHAEKTYTRKLVGFFQIPKFPFELGEKEAGQTGDNTLEDPPQKVIFQAGQTYTEGEKIVLLQITKCQYSSGQEDRPDYLYAISCGR